MNQLDLADSDYDRVMLLARAWQVSGGEAVRRLLDHFVREVGTPAAGQEPADDGVPIYADYGGERVEARYHKATKRVDITSGVLAGRSYKSPSGAAMGVVQALNPNVHNNRNGWSFWFIAENGEALQTIRP
ncbi:hypothetical protein [Amycolatopsis rubida]|uniref:RAMA domain-containing protein n=1 Tax=Amycolatopsis rubida TaxID=112413 RepID=A0A1I5WD55_9PSEU|nr:hypothetical protein [Amycolatopsis rubida]SFQ17694.1 hypothetical protein SAMN05421854_109172 [Amycolatopsis rubida]